MKFKLVYKLSLLSLALSFSAMAPADDLLKVYDQAVHNDPTFKQAQSSWWSAKQNLPISVAAYLPAVDTAYTLNREYANNKPQSAPQGWFTQGVLTLTVNQPIFDMGAWTAIQESGAGVKSATATYMASIQDLMARTATQYFAVLNSYDKLRFTIANANAVKRQLITAQQKYKVGLIAITGVYDAQSSYDQARANEISDRNNLYIQLELLRAITGQHYLSLKGIQDQVPLVSPAPSSIDSWVSMAEQDNYLIKANNFAAIQAHDNIKNQAAGFLPTVDATASYSNTKSSDFQKSNPNNNTLSVGGDYGLSLDWKPFSGGATYYATKQARYDYMTALGKLEFTHRDVVSKTRQAYLGVISGISQVQADKQSIVSAQKALKATEAGYIIGTRTMVNVLDDLTTVYQNENTYMNDQYGYINNVIALKEESGTLSMDDLRNINSWLKKNVTFPLPQNYYSHVKGASKANYDAVNKELGKGSSAIREEQLSTAAKKALSPVKVAQKNQQGNYVVQLYAADHLKQANKFLSHSNLQHDLRIVKVGKLYKVVYGDFKDRSNAMIALDGLPIKQAKQNAWVVRLPAKAQLAQSSHKRASVYSDGEGRVSKINVLPNPA